MPFRLSKSSILTPKNLSKFHFNPKTFQKIHFDPIILQNYISISKLSKITFQLKNFIKSHFKLENFQIFMLTPIVLQNYISTQKCPNFSKLKFDLKLFQNSSKSYLDPKNFLKTAQRPFELPKLLKDP